MDWIVIGELQLMEEMGSKANKKLKQNGFEERSGLTG